MNFLRFLIVTILKTSTFVEYADVGNQTLVALANRNRDLVHTLGRCSVPKPKMIPLENRHPSKTYTPHCVLLHRCSDETGCCRIDGQTCRKRTEEYVDLYFHVTVSENQQILIISRITYFDCFVLTLSKFRPEQDQKNHVEPLKCEHLSITPVVLVPVLRTQ